MQLIDDSGNLFGLVNVVDALVLLLVLAVGAAGVALVTADDGSSSEADRELATTNVTFDLGTQPEYVVERIDAGDNVTTSGAFNATITDVHVAPEAGDARVHVRTRVRGEERDGTVHFNGEPPLLGLDVAFRTDEYQTTATVTDVGGSDELAVNSTPVVVRANVSESALGEISPGETIRLAGHDIATVQSVAAYGTDDPDRRGAFVGLELRSVGEDRRFGGTRLREGENLSLETPAYDLDGTVQRVGATEPRGEAATREVTLELESVEPDLAEGIEVGDAERVGDRTVAEITDVERENATMLVTSDDGNVYLRDHPVNQDVTVTADLAVRETETGVTFKGERIQRGSTVVLDLGDVTVEATVRDL